jgi:hypothetical protein
MATTRIQNIMTLGGATQSPYNVAVATQEASAADAIAYALAQSGTGAYINGMTPNPNPLGFDCTKMQVALPTIAATQGTAITPASVTVQYGYSAYTFAAFGLPAGLSINISSGQVSGTPTTAGAYPYAVVVTDSNGNVAVATGSITVN